MENNDTKTEIGSDTAEQILRSINIPPCPEVVVTIMEEMRQDDVDFNKLTRLISGDVGLAASMLKTANSPYFALRNKATSVQQAVSVLGLKNLLQIVRGSALKNAMGGSGELHMERFWDRSNYTAVAASQIASHLHGISRDEAYTYGLFHDCGIPILMQKFPDYKEKLATANKSAEQIITIEDQHYSTNHSIVGNMLARNWGLPEHISTAIRVHHDPSLFTDGGGCNSPQVCTLVAIQLISEHIVASFLQRPDDAEWFLSGQAALDFLGIAQNELNDIMEDVLAELEESRNKQ